MQINCIDMVESFCLSFDEEAEPKVDTGLSQTTVDIIYRYVSMSFP